MKYTHHSYMYIQTYGKLLQILFVAICPATIIYTHASLFELPYNLLHNHFVFHFAVAPKDYVTLEHMILHFDECERKHCVNVTINNDMALELMESFHVTLERTSSLNPLIILNPVEGIINIVDNTCKTKSFSADKI